MLCHEFAKATQSHCVDPSGRSWRTWKTYHITSAYLRMGILNFYKLVILLVFCSESTLRTAKYIKSGFNSWYVIGYPFLSHMLRSIHMDMALLEGILMCQPFWYNNGLMLLQASRGTTFVPPSTTVYDLNIATPEIDRGYYYYYYYLGRGGGQMKDF